MSKKLLPVFYFTRCSYLSHGSFFSSKISVRGGRLLVTLSFAFFDPSLPLRSASSILYEAIGRSSSSNVKPSD